MGEQAMTQRLVGLLLAQKTEAGEEERNEKIKRVLLLLAGGVTLATVLVMPGTVRLFKDFFKPKSDWDEWKMFNESYLRRTIRRLQQQKVVTVEDHGDYGEVKLTENGQKRVLRMGLESLKISKPGRWDGKWRMVFYDVFDGKKSVRERFRGYLRGAGFYPLQKSVYLHAYPCEREIEFLKHFLGISGEVRVVIAEKIENDQEFRNYFGV
jgi:hypothetical protein